MNELAYRADALGFLAEPAKPPLADPALPGYVDLLHVTAAPPFSAEADQVIDDVGRFSEFVGRQPQLAVVRNQSEFRDALGGPATAVIMGLQRAPDDALDKLDALHDAGVRVMALEYQKGDGVHGSGWTDPAGPLTGRGRELLAAMAEKGMILDISHSGTRTADDALAHIESLQTEGLRLPVMASHGGVHEMYGGDKQDFNNLRNLPFSTLQTVAALGGVVGIYSLTFGLSAKDNSPLEFTRQIRWTDRELPGSVVIGSDAVYAERNTAAWRQTFEMLKDNIAAGTEMQPRFPDTPLELNGVDRLSRLAGLLTLQGLNQEDVDAIIGGRLVRFFDRSLPKA